MSEESLPGAGNNGMVWKNINLSGQAIGDLRIQQRTAVKRVVSYRSFPSRLGQQIASRGSLQVAALSSRSLQQDQLRR